MICDEDGRWGAGRGGQEGEQDGDAAGGTFCVTPYASPPVHHLRFISPGASPLASSLDSRTPYRSSLPCTTWRASHSHTLMLLHPQNITPSAVPSRLCL